MLIHCKLLVHNHTINKCMSLTLLVITTMKYVTTLKYAAVSLTGYWPAQHYLIRFFVMVFTLASFALCESILFSQTVMPRMFYNAHSKKMLFLNLL